MTIAWAIVALFVGVCVGVIMLSATVNEKYARVSGADIRMCIYKERAFVMIPLADAQVSVAKKIDSVDH